MPIQFIHPEYLWFLSLLLIPIIIHLFNFKRYKKIYFSNLQFLHFIDSENKRKSKLEKLILLLLRMLALACIIIAFSQPFVPKSNAINNTALPFESVDIFIDNSFSMNGNTERGNALEIAKNLAFDIVKNLPDYSKIRIYSSDIKHYTNNLNKNQSIARIQNIQPSPLSPKLSLVIKNIKIDRNQQKSKIYLLSDYQKQQSDFDKIVQDSTLDLTFIHLQLQPNNNLSLDSCWFQKSNLNQNKRKEIFVKIHNYSNRELKDIPIQLIINDSIKSNGSFDIKPNSSKTSMLRFADRESDNISAKIQIQDYPIKYDNTLYLSFTSINNRRILTINQDQPNPYLKKLFESDKNFKLFSTTKSQANNKILSEYQLVILNEITDIESGFAQTLKKYLKSGGNILYIPNKFINPSINSFMSSISAPQFLELDSTKQRISKIETESQLYKNVFQKLEKDVRLPDTYKHFHLSESKNKSEESLWLTAGNDVIFGKINYQNGNFYFLSINLTPEWSNVVSHPIFVPSIINLSLRSEQTTPLYYEIGKNNVIELNSEKKISNEKQFHLVNNKLKVDIIPQKTNLLNQNIKLYTYDQIRFAENYNIVNQGSIIKSCSFNYARNESSYDFYSLQDIQDKIIPNRKSFHVISSQKMKPSSIYNEQRDGRQIWKKFILFCFAFFFLEGLLRMRNF